MDGEDRAVDGWLAAAVESDAPGPQPGSVAELRERVPAEPAWWAKEAEGGGVVGACFALKPGRPPNIPASDDPSFLVVLSRPRPRTKLVEDLVLDVAGAALGARPTSTVVFHLLRRDGWALPVLQALGAQPLGDASVPLRGTAMVELRRLTVDEIDRGHA
jgi:hypothetical protein